MKRTALVTGGATGLGRAIAIDLAKSGVTVAVNYSKSEDDANNTVAEIKNNGGKAIAVKADVSSSSQITSMVEKVVSDIGNLDIIIANAGATVFQPFEDLDAVSEEDWDRIMNVNVKGVWLTVKTFAPYLNAKEENKAKIVITSSIAGLKPTGSSLPYSVSKAAVNHLTQGLAKALSPNILVNAIAPGILDTRWSQGHSSVAIENYVEKSSLNRIPTIEDCVKQTRALIENESMTGTISVIDSGNLL